MMSSGNSAQDWRALTLDEGVRIVIEASAGTGKTWTIAVVYLRLLLERGLSVREIVVSTFSDAAAQELQGRIRQRLLWALTRAEASPDPAFDPQASDEQFLRQRWLGNDALRQRDRLHLRLALSELDLAPISTLHGWCTRILRDFPFAAGSGFELGNLVSETDFHDELFDDLTRQLAQSVNPISDGDRYWLAHLSALRLALGQLRHGDLHLDVPEVPDIARILDSPLRPDLQVILVDVEGRFKRPNSAYRSQLRHLIEYLGREDWAEDPLDFSELIKQDWQKHFKPAHQVFCEQSPVLAFARTAAEAIAAYRQAQRAQALQRYHQQWQHWIRSRLSERGQFSYDQLIERVHIALTQTDRTLADALHRCWPAILIDEFQDTDARQFEIVEAIQRDAAAAPRGCTILVGDPKQAIYGFRGGDIHTYLRAVRTADQQLSLQTNHRSAPRYVEALNALYQRVAPGMTRANEDNGIDVPQVLPSERGVHSPYTIDDVPVLRPLVVHFDAAPASNKADRVRAALQACAGQIAELLQSGRHRLGATAVAPGDIAVLLPNHAQVAQLRALLLHRHVPCSGAGRQSVFDTVWARELLVILYALQHLDTPSAVRAACTARMFGPGPDSLSGLDETTEAWQSSLELLHTLAQIWKRQGVLALVHELVARAASQLQWLGDFERDATDLRHLGELLQEASEDLSGPEQLLVWLRTQLLERTDAARENEEQQLRIESDGARVRLLTLHASKGLEFGIVFLPLMWAHQAVRRAGYPVFTDSNDGSRRIDLGTRAFSDRLQQSARDDQDERFRVLYVALTRAVHACHVYALDPMRAAAGNRNSAESDPARSAWDALVARWIENAMVSGSNSDDYVDWRTGLPDADAIYQPPLADTQAPKVRPPPPARHFAHLHSFSSLTRGSTVDAREESATIDEEPVDLSSPAGIDEAALNPALSLAALDSVRGPQLGNALHMALELRDQSRRLSEQTLWLAQVLRQHRASRSVEESSLLAQRWATRLDAVLATDLGDGLRLDALPTHAQRVEMGFHFIVDRVRLDEMRRCCSRHGYDDLIPASIGHARLHGMVTGKIDLVVQHAGRFHVIDYKSNRLGAQLDHYRGAPLQTAMREHHYPFQALLYMLALDRYLNHRVDNYHRELQLGDAIYLLVRAVGLSADTGIWRQRVPDALIADLQSTLSGALE